MLSSILECDILINERTLVCVRACVCRLNVAKIEKNIFQFYTVNMFWHKLEGNNE